MVRFLSAESFSEVSTITLKGQFNVDPENLRPQVEWGQIVIWSENNPSHVRELRFWVQGRCIQFCGVMIGQFEWLIVLNVLEYT